MNLTGFIGIAAATSLAIDWINGSIICLTWDKILHRKKKDTPFDDRMYIAAKGGRK